MRRRLWNVRACALTLFDAVRDRDWRAVRPLSVFLVRLLLGAKL